MIKLDNVVEVFIPEADNEGKKIESIHIEGGIRRATQAVGGVTITEAVGGWVSTYKGALMKDDIKIYQWFYEETSRAVLIRAIKSIIAGLIREGGQEAVSIKVNGTLYIVEAHDLDGDGLEYGGMLRAII